MKSGLLMFCFHPAGKNSTAAPHRGLDVVDMAVPPLMGQGTGRRLSAAEYFELFSICEDDYAY